MSKIIDPDLLNQGTEIVYDTAARTIQLLIAGNLSDDGVAIQSVYSFTKEEWNSDSTLIKHPFPMKPIDGPSGTQFNLIEGWNWLDTTTTGLIRDGGWALKDAAGVSLEEWMNITSLGSFIEPSVDRAYYTQGDVDSPIDILLAGEVNQAIKIYGDVSHGDVDYRADFIIQLREEQKTFDAYDLIIEQNITALTYKKYALPLSNVLDANVTHTDVEIAAAPYLNIDLTIFVSAEQRNIGGVPRDFKRIFEGDGKVLEEIFEKHQYLYRQTTDIDEGAGTLRGDTAQTRMYWANGKLYVDGYVDNILTADANRVVFIDDGGTERENPYVSAGTLEFNSALSGDSDSIYRLFFKTDDLGDNTGRDYGTDDALLVHGNDKASSGDISFTTNNAIATAGATDFSVFSIGDSIQVSGTTSNDGFYVVATVSATDITVEGTDIATEAAGTTFTINKVLGGIIDGNSSISFDYDYNNNEQRGAASTGTDAIVILVGIGLEGGQFVVAEGTIEESKTIKVSLVANDELTYTNPA